MVGSVNDNATYHLTELNGTRIGVPIARKRIKAFKKRHEEEPDLEYESKHGEPDEPGVDREVDGSESEEKRNSRISAFLPSANTSGYAVG